MKRILDFFSEVRVELSKVVWPTKETTFRLTLLVIVVTICVGFFIGVVDFLLVKANEWLLK